MILVLITSVACVPKRDTASPSNPTTPDADRIAALESKVSQLQSKIASLPESSGGNYDADISQLQNQINDLQMQLDDILVEVSDTLAAFEEEQEEQVDGATIEIDETTRWSLDIWTDYESFNLLDINLDHKKIEEEDDYTIWLLLFNNNHTAIGKRDIDADRPVTELTVGYLYYATDTKKLWKATSATTWTEVTNFASIYQLVEIKEITVQFSPRSSDRVIVDESQTELYSMGYPSFDWDMDYSNRNDGTCKRIEATTDDRLTLRVPTEFYNGDPEKPYPEEFKLEFGLAYK